MLKDALSLLLLTTGLALASAQDQEKEPVWALKFQDYAVKDVFQGKPAPVILPRTWRSLRTRIREGAAQGPNFAGHYTVVGWGCGAGCVALVLVDAITGRVCDMPFGTLAMNSPFDASLQKGPVYQLKSRLFIADGCPNEEEKCGAYYYEWKNNKFVLLRFDPAPAGK